MESINMSSRIENFTYTNKQPTISPFSYLHIASSNSDSNLMELKGSPKTIIKNHQSKNNNSSFHQRCSSVSSLLLNIEDDQPSWLADLHTEPETPTIAQHNRNRTSVSSSILELSYNQKSSSSEENSIDKPLYEKHDKGDSKDGESSGEKSNSKSMKSDPKKMETKKAKQHYAHRSRVRKLKYIAELENTVQLLRAEGSKIQGELEFVNQQNLILSMENMALRQRLDSVSQEQLIKHFEQEILERELGRLQSLHQLQNQQQLQFQHQMIQH